MELYGFVDDRRAILEMAGGDAREVLQSVVTNDVERVAPGRAVYAALLTPQGKYLFDFFLLDGTALGRPAGSVLIDVAAARAAALAQRLKMYCLRRDARITGAAGFGVVLVWDTTGGDGPAVPPVAAPGAIVVPDPRAASLGWRLYGPEPALPDGVLAAGPEDIAAVRVAAGVPETGVELVPDESYILEAGFERLDGVDFRKGCYVGQEVTARMKHKTALRKGLVQVDVDGAAPPGTPITAGGKPAGTLFTVADGRGLAHLRLDRAGPDMEAGGATVHYRS